MTSLVSKQSFEVQISEHNWGWHFIIENQAVSLVVLILWFINDKNSYTEFPLSVILVANFITRQNTTINLSSSRQGCNSKTLRPTYNAQFHIINFLGDKQRTHEVSWYQNIIIEISHLNTVCSGWLPAQVFWLRSEKSFLQPLRIGWRRGAWDRFVVVVIVLLINLIITKSSATIKIW